MTYVDQGNLELISSPCPLCGGLETEVIWRHPNGIANGICTVCGHVYLSQRYPDLIIEESYNGYGQCYSDAFLADEGNPLFAIARKRFNFLKEHLPARHLRSVLEIGCGYGHFLKVLGSMPSKVGIEPSSAQAFFARSSFGLEKIMEGTYETSLPISEQGSKLTFDVICSFHVIEHLINPVNFIKRVREQLRPNGYLFLALPDLSTLSPDLIELYFIYRNWHIHSFSPLTITQLLESNGLRIVSIEEEEPTAMLRSSFLVLAQRSDGCNPELGFSRTIEENRLAAKRFHQTLDDRLLNLRSAFAQWSSSGKRSAIYGGGIHTQALLELTGIDRSTVKAIIDDDPDKVGSDISGIPIMPFSTALTMNPDVVLVSSLASEQSILHRLESSELRPDIELKGIYRDYMN